MAREGQEDAKNLALESVQALACQTLKMDYPKHSEDPPRWARSIVTNKDKETFMPLAEMSIEFLADCPEAIPTVCQWLIAEWGDPQARTAVDDLCESLKGQLNRDRVPVQLVAIIEQRVVGVAMLKEHELRSLYPDLKNWLGSVFVDPSYRQQGVASGLVERAVALAGEFGIRKLHLQTLALEGGLYTKLGWQPSHRVHHLGLERLVMTKQIPTEAED